MVKLAPLSAVPSLNTQSLIQPAEQSPSNRGLKSTRKKKEPEESKQSPSTADKLQIKKLSLPTEKVQPKHKNSSASIVFKVEEEEAYVNAKTMREQRTARRREMREHAEGGKTNRDKLEEGQKTNRAISAAVQPQQSELEGGKTRRDALDKEGMQTNRHRQEVVDEGGSKTNRSKRRAKEELQSQMTPIAVGTDDEGEPVKKGKFGLASTLDPKLLIKIPLHSSTSASNLMGDEISPASPSKSKR